MPPPTIYNTFVNFQWNEIMQYISRWYQQVAWQRASADGGVQASVSSVSGSNEELWRIGCTHYFEKNLCPQLDIEVDFNKVNKRCKSALNRVPENERSAYVKNLHGQPFAELMLDGSELTPFVAGLAAVNQSIANIIGKKETPEEAAKALLNLCRSMAKESPAPSTSSMNRSVYEEPVSTGVAFYTGYITIEPELISSTINILELAILSEEVSKSPMHDSDEGVTQKYSKVDAISGGSPWVEADEDRDLDDFLGTTPEKVRDLFGRPEIPENAFPKKSDSPPYFPVSWLEAESLKTAFGPNVLVGTFENGTVMIFPDLIERGEDFYPLLKDSNGEFVYQKNGEYKSVNDLSLGLFLSPVNPVFNIGFASQPVPAFAIP